MADIIIAGEDTVTREIIKRLIEYAGLNINISREEPIRGGKILESLPKYNILGLPVIALIDLDDADCPVSLLNNIFHQTPINNNLLLRIAVDEAESWLMADKEGFSQYLSIPFDKIPANKSLDSKNDRNIELRFPYKPSLYLMRELASISSNTELKKQLTPKEGAKKGPEYNTAITPFIREKWDIKNAMRNSYSLQKAIQRIGEFSYAS